MALNRKPWVSPTPRLPLSTAEGLERLVRSRQAERFFRLANHYRFQTDCYSCGLASMAMVLNVLRYGTSLAPESGAGIRAFTTENVLNERSEAIKPQSWIRGRKNPGLNLEQLRRILSEVHGVAVEKHEAHPNHREELKEILLDALASPERQVIVNFKREPSGHFSPLGAYDDFSHSTLVLDTNPSQQPWHWMDIDELFDLMETKDGAEYRGFLIIQ